MKKSSIIALISSFVLIIGIALFSYFFLLKDDIKVNITATSEGYGISWEEVDNAQGYKVFVNGSEVDGVSSSTCNLTDYLIGDGLYEIALVAYDKNNNEIKSTTINYAYEATTENDFIRKGQFYFGGKWHDYIIEDELELEKLVWHTILYRNNNVSFYIKSGSGLLQSNVNQLTKRYIESYPEYDAVTSGYGKYAKITHDNVGMLCNFIYYLNDNFLLTHEDISVADYEKYNLAKYDYPLDNTYTEKYTTMETAERTFPIDAEGVPEVYCENTEQLFMAVQFGARPVFANNESVAAVVYENAKKVLREINNNDNLSEFDKAKNIYDYICSNVKYDYVLYEYMRCINDFSIASFGNYSVFYLEGVLYDLENQYAVCDGLSKAYTLMCRIEGIECCKVNGYVNMVGNAGNHAWNKVKIGANETLGIEQDAWSIVDTTWGKILNTNSKGQVSQIVSHSYFLISEETFEKTRSVIFVPVTAPTQEVTYYKHKFYSLTGNAENTTSNDFYIETVEELEDIFAYAVEKKNTQGVVVVLDIRLSANNAELKAKADSFLENADSEIRKIMWYESLGVTNTSVDHISIDTNHQIFDDYHFIFRIY